MYATRLARQSSAKIKRQIDMIAGAEPFAPASNRLPAPLRLSTGDSKAGGDVWGNGFDTVWQVQ